MIEFLLRLWYSLLDRIWPAATYRVWRVEERPEVPAAGRLYVIGQGEHVWEAAMRCPNGCGRTLSMNLLPTEKPCWKLEEHDDCTASLSPSVWRKTGCGCHFVLKRGRIQWVQA
jgi:Family of unknown function (DUF6527)